MSDSRIHIAISILRGFLTAAAITLFAMTLIAGLTLIADIPDAMLFAVNQLLKALSIFVGVAVTVGRGGSRGLVTGVVVALLYMVAGYVLYIKLGGGAGTFSAMLGEILLGVTIGGITGAIFANLTPRKKKRRA